MNENLIALLAIKATRDNGWLDRQLFAELIIRECAQVASDYDGAHHVGTAIENHFGLD